MSHAFHHQVDRLINMVKWPAAAASLLILLPGALTLQDILKMFWRSPHAGLALSAGLCVFALAWHLLATCVETHLQQTDLREVGLLFSVVFLPGVSLLSIGFVLTLAHFGSGAPAWYWDSVSRNVSTTVHFYTQWGLQPVNYGPPLSIASPR